MSNNDATRRTGPKEATAHAHDVTVAFVTHDYSHTCLAVSAEDDLQCHCRLGEHIGGSHDEMVQKVHPGAPPCSMLLHVDRVGMHGIWEVV